MSISDDEVEAAARAFDPFSFQSWQQSYDYEMAKSADAVEAKAFADWCMGKKIEEARTGARTALSAAAKVRASREGDGEWVMVPRIETDEMCEAGLEALRENLGHSSVIMRDAAACYRAMVHSVAASPSATGGEKE